jgi:hypothetical protein
MVELYATPTVPFGSVPVVIVKPAGWIVRLTGPVTVSAGLLESVACTVKITVPATVGVPLTTQPFSERPVGSVPAWIEQL